jgi:hypothetical protein
LDPQEISIGQHGRIGEHLVRGRGVIDPREELLPKLGEHGDYLELRWRSAPSRSIKKRPLS